MPESVQEHLNLQLCKTGSKSRTTQKKGQDMPVYTATDYEPLDPGLYVGRFVEVREAKSEHGAYYRWIFEIRDEEHGGRQIHANVSDKFGPGSKARQWVEAMIGRRLANGERFDTDDLIGQDFHVTVVNVEKDGRTYDNIASVNAIRKTKAAKMDEPDAGEADEEEFANLPI
jgi:hypothetical protein